MNITINTMADAAEYHENSQYRKEHFEQAFRDKAEIEAAGFPVSIEYDTENGFCHLWLNKDEGLLIRKDSYRQIWIVSSNKRFKNINYHGIQEATKDIPKPNNFKVPTKKKIQDWIDFVKKCEAAEQALSVESEKKHQAFKQKVADLSANFGCEYKPMDEKSGYLDYYFDPEHRKAPDYSHPHLSIKFSLSDNGYTSTEIKLCGVYNIDEVSALIASLKRD